MSLLAFLLVSSPAHAGIYGGNPDIVIKVDRPAHDITSAVVVVDKVRVNYCGGGYTDYEVDAQRNLANSWTITVSGGDFCGIRVYWTSAMSISSSSFGLSYNHAYTDVSVGDTIPTVALAPFTVVWGVIYGGNPELVVNID